MWRPGNPNPFILNIVEGWTDLGLPAIPKIHSSWSGRPNPLVLNRPPQFRSS